MYDAGEWVIDGPPTDPCFNISYDIWLDIQEGRLPPACDTGSFYWPFASCLLRPEVGYSPSDCDYIAIDQHGAYFRYVEEMFGNGALHYVVAHEYAHAIQWRVGLIQMEWEGQWIHRMTELQADCFTGAVLAAPPTPPELIDLLTEIGSEYWRRLGSYDRSERTHGTADERQQAFTFGVENGVSACVTEYTPQYWDA